MFDEIYRYLSVSAVIASAHAVLLASTISLQSGQGSVFRSPIADIPAVRALVNIALESNPDIGAARYHTSARRDGLGLAGALPDPEVSLGYARSPELHVVITEPNGTNAHNFSGALPGMTEYSMSLGQGIPWPRKLAAKEDLARQDIKRSEVGLHESTLALEAELLTSCLELLVITARRDLLVTQLEHWGVMEETIKSRLDQGGNSSSEAIQAMQERGRLKLRLLELDSRAENLADIVNQLAAREQGSPVVLGVTLSHIALPRSPDESELLDDLKNRNPQWLAAQAEIRVADATLHVAKMERFPDFHAGVSISKAGTMPPGWMAEVGVSLPIWSRRKQSKMVAMARTERQIAQSGQSSLSLALAAKSRERARGWRLAEQTLKVFEGELIPQNEAALEILKARFQNGSASFGLIIEALNMLLKDQEERLDAIEQIHRYSIMQHAASL